MQKIIACITWFQNIAYGNTKDPEKAASVWDKLESKMRSDGENDSDIRFHKENFRILDSQRHFV